MDEYRQLSGFRFEILTVVFAKIWDVDIMGSGGNFATFRKVLLLSS